MVTLLLADERVDAGIANKQGKTALCLASATSQTSELLRRAKDLISAAEMGDETMVASALRNSLVDPNMINQKGSTALIFAAFKGHAWVVRLLLADERIDCNIANQDGNTALIFAANEGHGTIVTLLLADKRVDPKCINQDGNTALSVAAIYERHSVVKLLLADERVDPNIAHNQGKTALELSKPTSQTFELLRVAMVPREAHTQHIAKLEGRIAELESAAVSIEVPER